MRFAETLATSWAAAWMLAQGSKPSARVNPRSRVYLCEPDPDAVAGDDELSGKLGRIGTRCALDGDRSVALRSDRRRLETACFPHDRGQRLGRCLWRAALDKGLDAVGSIFPRTDTVRPFPPLRPLGGVLRPQATAEPRRQAPILRDRQRA